MFSAKYFAFLCGIVAAIAEPDSAGIVPMPDGLAYGGIPYGSVSGMLADYQRQWNNNFVNKNYEYPQSGSPIIVTPNVRASGWSNRQNGPVQIYKLPGVVAPGVLGTISQIGY